MLNDFILGSRLKQFWDAARVPKHNHYILCGLGAIGIQIVRQLQSQGHEGTIESENLITAEEKQVTDKKLMTLPIANFKRWSKSGDKKTFSVEQIVQIVAIACEDPSSSERPISHWTPRELAAEAVKRGIVAHISPRSVGRFLKGSHSKTTSSSLLVKSQSRSR